MRELSSIQRLRIRQSAKLAKRALGKCTTSENNNASPNIKREKGRSLDLSPRFALYSRGVSDFKDYIGVTSPAARSQQSVNTIERWRARKSQRSLPPAEFWPPDFPAAARVPWTWPESFRPSRRPSMPMRASRLTGSSRISKFGSKCLSEVREGTLTSAFYKYFLAPSAVRSSCALSAAEKRIWFFTLDFFVHQVIWCRAPTASSS